MNLTYKRATENDIELLTETRIEVLRAANLLEDNVDMSIVRKQSRDYYQKFLKLGEHIAYLVFDENTVIAAGGVSFFRVMPTYHNPSGWKAYLMNMYTSPEYRRNGIAFQMLELLITDTKERGIKHISLEATKAGRPLYQKFGFQEMKNEMELIV